METLNYRHASEVWPDAAEQLVSPPVGISLPQWPTFSQYVGGLRPHELTLICAPTGAGKTQFLANVSTQLLAQEIGQFIAPVETGDVDFLLRVLSCMEGRDFCGGEAVSVEYAQSLHNRATRLILDRPLWLASYDNRVEIEEMANLLKFMHAEGARVAVLDNLNFFLNVTSSTMERAEMDNAMHAFVMLAKKIPIHILLVCHPRKTDGGRVESEFDIKGSSLAVQEASNVILFNRPNAKDVESGAREWTDRELVFKKIRKRGVNVNKPIWFRFNQGRYEEVRG